MSQQYQNGRGQGRKPVSLTSAEAGGRATGYQAIWEAIRAQREFTFHTLWLDVDTRCGGNKWTIKSYLKRLKKAGHIEVVDEQRHNNGAARTYIYRLVNDTGVDAPRLNKDGTPSKQGLGREQMWRSMKIMGEFTAKDLAIHSSTEDVTVSEASAKDYLKHLAKAGYFAVRVPNRGSHSQTRYKLLPSRWRGPKAPMIQRVKAVYDPNLGKIVWPEELSHD